MRAIVGAGWHSPDNPLVRVVEAFHLRRRAARGVAAVLVLIAGCDADGSVVGTYVFQSSSVVTARPDSNVDACGLPAFPHDQYRATFVVAEPRDGTVTVLEQINECTFRAQVQGATISAANVECDISPTAAVRRQWGLIRRRYADFSLDVERGVWTAETESWQELANGTVHTCATAAGRLVSFRRSE